jgi:hypothetical protein
MTKFSRTSTGKYSVAGKTYEMLIGTRAQVWHGTAYKTTGGLTHSDLMKNKSGRIVSKAKHNTAKKDKRLIKAGYFTKKGHFGFVKKTRGGSASASTPSTSSVPSSTSGSMSNTGSMSSSANAMLAKMPTMPSTNATTMKKGGRNNRSRSRGRRGGGLGSAFALSPAPFDGKGVGTSGNAVQFAAGAGN